VSTAWLRTPEGGRALRIAYLGERLTTRQLAERFNVSAPSIRAALSFHCIPRRDNSEAQKVAIEEGRHKHPDLSRPKTEIEKAETAKRMRAIWQERKRAKTGESEPATETKPVTPE